MSVRFNLTRRTGYPETRPVSVRVIVSRTGRTLMSRVLPLSIAPTKWSTHKQRVKPSVPSALEINSSLDEIELDISAILLRPISDAEAVAAVDERLGRAPQVEDNPAPSLLEQFDAFIEQKKVRTRYSTVQVYNTLRTHLAAFLGEDVSVNRVGPGFLDDFAAYLTGAGLANSTANKLLTRAKGFLSFLVKRGVLDSKPETKPLPTSRNPALYLTLEELGRLLQVDLANEQPGYRAARDLFIAGAVTGQRYGDLKGMQWSNLDLKRGWWNLRVEKTNVTLRVPLAEPVRRIIESRRGEETPLPVLSNQKANAYLKEVCKLAGIDAPVSVQTLRGGQREEATHPKWQVVTMHAARKTFVTLSLQGGTPQSELLDFTHSDLRTLQLYAGKDEAKRQEHVNRVFGGLW